MFVCRHRGVSSTVFSVNLRPLYNSSKSARGSTVDLLAGVTKLVVSRRGFVNALVKDQEACETPKSRQPICSWLACLVLASDWWNFVFQDAK